MRAIHCFTALSLIASCASEEGETSGDTDVQHELSFHGEQEAFPDFGYDTGALPDASSPVQLRLTFSAAGKLTADAVATTGGTGDALAVAGKPGSGTFALDAHLKAAANLKVNITGLPSYDGPIPGIENLDIALANTVQFDPFLMGGSSAILSVNLPETELPPIPLGSVPGKLIVTVSGTSTVNSTLTGICAGLDQKKIQFLTETATSAMIVLKPKIVISVPVIGDKEFAIPEITIRTPAIKAPMDMGTLDAVEGGAVPTGTSMAANASCAGATCKAPSTIDFEPMFKAPQTHRNLCSTSQLYAFVNACGVDASTRDTCQAFLNDAANATCESCLRTDSTERVWGAFVDGLPNIGGCISAMDGTQSAMGADFMALTQCEFAACDARCEGATTEESNACLTAADNGVCSTYVDRVNNAMPSGAAIECVSPESEADMYMYYGDLFCGS